MYPNSHRDYDNSFAAERETQDKLNSVVSLVSDNRTIIKKHIDTLSLARPVEGESMHIVSVTFWDDEIHTIKHFLNELLKETNL